MVCVFKQVLSHFEPPSLFAALTLNPIKKLLVCCCSSVTLNGMWMASMMEIWIPDHCSSIIGCKKLYSFLYIILAYFYQIKKERKKKKSSSCAFPEFTSVTRYLPSFFFSKKFPFTLQELFLATFSFCILFQMSKTLLY